MLEELNQRPLSHRLTRMNADKPVLLNLRLSVFICGQHLYAVAAGTPASFFFFKNGIILRSSAPTFSIF